MHLAAAPLRYGVSRQRVIVFMVAADEGYFYFEGGVRYERNRLQRSTLRENESRAGQIPGLATASGAVRNPQSYLRIHTMREDIVMCMEELELEPEKARAFIGNDVELLRNTLYQNQYIYMAV